jgi:putative ABC transport system ATP-binding protein
METTQTPAVPGPQLVSGPAPTLLELQGIRKVFLTDEVETHALSDVHLAVKKGEWLAIVGPSGSGKTTLLALLGLLDTPSAGTFLLDGKPVQDLSPADRAHVRNKHIGFIFQSFNLIGDLTVFENVELPLTYRGMAPDERKRRVEQALERVGMSHRARHMPGQLSGGQQQRVAVARAVAGDPLILLADEPTGNLDSKNGQAVMKLLRELHQSGSTLIMVTHDPAYARLASRTVTLFDGRIVDESSSPAGEGQFAPSA